MPEEKKTVELKDDNLEKVAGGYSMADEKTMPRGTDENTDKATLENLQDNKGANE